MSSLDWQACAWARAAGEEAQAAPEDALMTRPAWLDVVPKEHRRHDRTMVGAIGEDVIDIRRADHADTYELRVGSDETVRSGYFGLVVVTPERLDDPSHLVRATRMQIALQMLADLGVKAFVRGGLVVLEARWR